MPNPIPSTLGALFLAVMAREVSAAPHELPKDVTRVPVVFAGGHETDPRDRGRPVVLIAAGLGVSSDVFREAFSHVHPAGLGQQPEAGQVRDNKAALMSALEKFGVTNDRLDEVSNYYRYVRSRDELWTHKEATAFALVKNGAVVGYEITSGGAGYSSAPTLTVPNIKAAPAKVEIAFSKVLEINGAVSAITIPAAGQK